MCLIGFASIVGTFQGMQPQERTVDGHIIEYVLNQKGNLTLMINGYTFHRSKITDKKTYYTCAHETTFRYTIHCFNRNVWFMPNENTLFDNCCRCRARARQINGTNEIEIVDAEHNHPSVVPRKLSGENRKLRKTKKKERKWIQKCVTVCVNKKINVQKNRLFDNLCLNPLCASSILEWNRL